MANSSDIRENRRTGDKGSGIVVAAGGDLRSELAATQRELERLRQRREEDLKRLKEVTRTRDLLEGRLAAQSAKVSDALKKIADKEKLLDDLDQRIGGARLLRESGETPEPRAPSWGWISSPLRTLWWRLTYRDAQRARREGRLVEAQILLDAALMRMEDGSLWTQLAHVLRERELFDAAEAAYDRALEFDSGDAENIFLAGYCSEMMGRKTAAATRYEEALRKDPQLASKYDHLRDFNARLFG